MKSLSRALALLLSVLIVLSAMPVFAAAADSFADFPKGSWSEAALTAAIDNGLLTGKGNGLIAPKDYLTRAEAATIINRAFGAKVEADISAYTDINPGDWYYSEFRKAVNMGTITGVSANRLDPQGYITREQILTVLARALVLDDQSASYLAKFQDGGAVSSWAKGASAAMAAKGYINGNDKGMLNPQGLITREEFAQIMHNIFKTYIPETVTINWGTYGTTVIRAKDVSLSNVTINGDLIVADGVANGNFTLSNVTVTGRILFRGGEGAVKITNSLVGENVVINDVNGVVNFLNYRAESVFDGIKENTPATFLNMSVNTGGSGSGSSSPSREEYTVKEYIEELDGTYSLYNSTEKKDKYNEEIEYDPRSITGFTFDDTHPNSVLEGKNNGKLTLKAYYKRNSYAVSLGGYTTELLYEQGIGEDAGLRERMEALVDDNEDAGYSTSFNTKPDGTGEIVDINSTTVGAQNLEIYAITTPITYTITYVTGLNASLDGTQKTDYTVEDGDYTLPTPVFDGALYVFLGWHEKDDFSDSVVTVLSSGSVGNKTYYAHIVDKGSTVTKYTIEFQGVTYTVSEGEKIGDAVDADGNKLSDAMDLVVADPGYERDGFRKQGDDVTVITKDTRATEDMILLVANKLIPYTITYNLNGFGTLPSGAPESYDVTQLPVTLPVLDDTLTHTFEGWFENASFDGEAVTAILVGSIGNKEYFARWEEIIVPETEYTIDYITNGGALDGSEKTTYKASDADYTLPIPTREDFVFKGWYEDEFFDGDKVEVLSSGSTGDKTYYAKWVPEYTNLYFVTVVSQDTVVIKVMLKDIPSDIENIGAMNITFTQTPDVLIYKSISSPFGTPEFKNGVISWYNTTPITADMLDDSMNLLFEITYDRPANTYGNIELDYTKWSLYDVDAKKSEKVDANDMTLRLGQKEEYTIYFRTVAYTVSAGEKIGEAVDANGNKLSDVMDLVVAEPGYERDGFRKLGDDVTVITKDTYATEDMTIIPANRIIIYIIDYELNGFGTLPPGAPYSYDVVHLPVLLPVLDDVETHTFEGWYGNPSFDGSAVTEISDGTIGDKVFYARWEEIIVPEKAVVKLYSGTVRNANFEGQYEVETGTTLTTAQVNAVLGDPSTYTPVNGYTDSDGNVHKVYPELWYKKNGEWVTYVPEDVVITGDMDICLLTRYVSVEYTTDLTFKGIEIPPISATIAYDSNTDIGKSFLDALTSLGKTMDSVLTQIETQQGVDLYEFAIEKAASKGLVDTDGNILNPTVPVPLHKFITKDFITGEIDEYIEDHIDDDEFIADLISNDHVEATLLADEGLREKLLTDSESKAMIKEKILDSSDDETFREDVKAVLKSDLKQDTVKMLGDSQIKDAMISAVESYLERESITYITAEEVVNKYIAGTLDAEHNELYDDVVSEYENTFEEKYDSYFERNFEQLMADHFDSYFDDTAEAYINHSIDPELKAYIDDKIAWYERKLIDEFISGVDRTLLHNAIPEYAEDAIAAIKTTNAYNGPIDDFISGNGVRVNEENLVFIEVLDSIMHKFDYDSLVEEILPENIKKVLELVDSGVAEEYVEKYLAVFCEGMDNAIEQLNADLEDEISGTVYKFTTSPATRINYMEILDAYYTKLMDKMRDKIISQSKIPVSSNPYAKRLVETDFFALLFDDAHNADEVKSGYKLKDDVMDYYNNALEIAVLIHDAVTYYGNMDEYTLEDKLDSASLLIGTYMNKANDLVMNFIENGELPKGYTLEDILDINGRIESLYNRFESKIEKGEDLYAEYLDRDYTKFIDLANMTVYADGKPYYLHEIILECGDDAFDVDDAVTAIFESPNYRDISKIENAMARIEAKIRSYEYNPTPNAHIYYVDAYRGTVGPKSIKGYSTGSHTVALQRYLRYIEN